MRPRSFRPLLLAAAVLAAGTAQAQRESYTYLSYVGPEVSLVSPTDEDSAARMNMPVLPGDVLVTAGGSRVEAVLSDGNVVRLDGRSELRFEKLNRTYEADDDRTILALARGTVAVDVREALDSDRALRLDTDDASVLAPYRAVFRVDAGRRGTEVYVLAGRVEVSGRGGRALVSAGEYAFVSGDANVEVEPAAAPRDRFARFLDERRERADELEANGTWTFVPSAGTSCWRPNVPADWTPYSLGTWRASPGGLTWVSYESWGWLPFHYGRWAWDPEIGWYWIPGDLFAPAWVYWSYDSDWTGWCPIGWYGDFYESYYRSTRPTYGNERGGGFLPNLRGKVEVTQIDRRGWNFAPTARVGSRLERRDVTRGDRVAFPRGHVVVVTTAPVRVDGAGRPSTSVPDAIRRASLSDASARGPANDAFTSILRRDRVLDLAARDELRRSIRPARDLVVRTASTDARARATADSWRAGTHPTHATNATGVTVRPDGAAPRDGRGRSDEGWRSSTTLLPVPVDRRDGERRERQGDSGWRAPAPRVVERSSERPVYRGGDAPVRRDGGSPSVGVAPSRSEPVHSSPPPVYSAPVSAAPMYSAPPPAPVSAPAPAPAPAPAQAPAAAARDR